MGKRELARASFVAASLAEHVAIECVPSACLTLINLPNAMISQMIGVAPAEDGVSAL